MTTQNRQKSNATKINNNNSQTTHIHSYIENAINIDQLNIARTLIQVEECLQRVPVINLLRKSKNWERYRSIHEMET